jgi:DNA (cytosine-5)-methyltransferase 1
MKRTLKVCDLFCGAGGSSTGIQRALERLGHGVELTAINHWDVAIATHTANFPNGRHCQASVDELNPRNLYKEGELDILWASPECVFHSIARGGKPVDDQRRATAWCVVRWAEACLPGVILVENVKEFEDWGPLQRVKRQVKVEVPAVSFRKWLRSRTEKGKRRKGEKGHQASASTPLPQCSSAPLPSVRQLWKATCPKVKREITKLVWVPDPKKKGQTFQAWVNAIRALGYKVEWRVLCAADFGAPTTRRRLFIHAVRGRRKVVWPNPSHAEHAAKQADLLQSFRPWTPASAIINWNKPGLSIYQRKRPLCDKTMRRIMIGLQKFGLGPFIVPQRSADDRLADIKNPLQTVTSESRGIGLATPFIVPNFGERDGQQPRSHSIDEPLPAVTSHGAGALVQPFILPNEGVHGGNAPRSIEDPLHTVTACKGAGAIVQPYLVELRGTALCEPFLIGQQSDAAARPVSQPAPTVATAGAISLTQPYVVAIDHKGGNGHQVHSATRPLGTVTSKQRHAVVEPMLIKFYGSAEHVNSIQEPLDTITTKDRFGLAQPITQVADDVRRRTNLEQPIIEIDGRRYLLDILFRMLDLDELSAAQGFPRDYLFTGTKTDGVKQVGNAVPPCFSEALVTAAITQLPDWWN